MYIGNDDDLMSNLMNAKGSCPNCNTQLTFEDSARLAKDNGVSENAVMCYNCHKVFNVNITPNNMTLLNELTKYNFSNKIISNQDTEKTGQQSKSSSLSSTNSSKENQIANSQNNSNNSSNNQNVNQLANEQNPQNYSQSKSLNNFQQSSGNFSSNDTSYNDRIKRDKKIILAAIILVASLIIIGAIFIPAFNDDYSDYDYSSSDDYQYSYDTDYVTGDISDYTDISSSSNLGFEINDVHRDSDGWIFVYGRFNNVNLDDYTAFSMYYDKSYTNIANTTEYLGGYGYDDVMVSGDDFNNMKITRIDVYIIDENKNIVDKDTYAF